MKHLILFLQLLIVLMGASIFYGMIMFYMVPFAALLLAYPLFIPTLRVSRKYILLIVSFFVLILISYNFFMPIGLGALGFLFYAWPISIVVVFLAYYLGDFAINFSKIIGISMLLFLLILSGSGPAMRVHFLYQYQQSDTLLEKITLGQYDSLTEGKTICSQMVNSHNKDRCYFILAEREADFTLCNNLSYNSNLRFSCYSQWLIETYDAYIENEISLSDSLDVCHEMIDTKKVILCITEFAINLNDSSICDHLLTTNQTLQCVAELP